MDAVRTLDVGEDECRFSIPEAGRYSVQRGRHVAIQPYPRVDPAIVRLFLLGSAWGAVLHQRGTFALHAGVTADDAGAYAFCGPPGAGKSSTVAWLLRCGHRLVSDDLTRVELPTDGSPQVWPSSMRVKLAADALDASGWRPRPTAPRLPDDKFDVRWHGRRVHDAIPLRAAFVLQWGAPGLRRLRGAEAVGRFLIAATYRPQLLEPASRLAVHWDRCAEIARRIPIWELSRRRDWSEMAETVEQLASLLTGGR